MLLQAECLISLLIVHGGSELHQWDVRNLSCGSALLSCVEFMRQCLEKEHHCIYDLTTSSVLTTRPVSLLAQDLAVARPLTLVRHF